MSTAVPPLCARCGVTIHDLFIMWVNGKGPFHPACAARLEQSEG